MISSFVLYSPLDGRIELYGRCLTSLVSAQEQRGLLSIEAEGNTLNHYVQLTDNSLQSKTEASYSFDTLVIQADGIEEATLSGLPLQTIVTFSDGSSETVMDGSVEFSVDLEGSYLIHVDSPEYFKKEFTIEATA